MCFINFLPVNVAQSLNQLAIPRNILFILFNELVEKQQFEPGLFMHVISFLALGIVKLLQLIYYLFMDLIITFQILADGFIELINTLYAN